MYKFFSIILSDSCQAVSSPYWDFNELLNSNELFLYKIILFSGYFLFGIGTWSSFWNCLLWLLWQIFQKVSLFYKERSSMESNQIHKELLKLINIERTFQQNASIDFSHTLVILYSYPMDSLFYDRYHCAIWHFGNWLKWYQSGNPFRNHFAMRIWLSRKIRRLF